MRKSYWIGAVLAALIGAWVLMPAIGEDEDRPPRQPRGQGGKEGQGGRMMGMGPMQSASVCALGNAIYVVRGNTIYKIDPETLQVVKKATYEEEQMPGRPPGGEGGPDDGPPPDEGR
ncbi:MAG: hypothetical protein AAB434_03135 [Planctomycetota bacterium]